MSRLMLLIVLAAVAVMASRVRINTLDQRAESRAGGDERAESSVESALNHTQSHKFGECECAITSGNKKSCCSAGYNKGMGTGTFCGNAMHRRQCGGDTPVCCTSHAEVACWPKGHTCSWACHGHPHGGGTKRDPSCHGLAAPRESAASVQYDERRAKAFSALAQAAYCGPVGYAPNSQALLGYTCEKECADAKFRIADVRTVTRTDTAKERSDDSDVTFAFVARMLRTSSQEFLGCVVGLPGTMHKHQWRRNLQVKERSVESDAARQGCPQCTLHKGWQTIWMSLVDGDEGVEDLLQKQGCGKGSGKFVYATGQSLGAALATIAMFDLQSRGYRMGQSYVFNSPRVGNKWFSQKFRNKAFFEHDVPLFRINNLRDPTSHLPPPNFGFKHAGAEVYYQPSWPDEKKKFVVCSIDNEEDRSCSRRYNINDALGYIQDHCEGLPFAFTAQGKEKNVCGWMDMCLGNGT